MRPLALGPALVAILAAGAPAQTLDETAPVLLGLFNLYAPSVLHPPAVPTSRMWIAGWREAADIPDDRIYRSDLAGGLWTAPEPAFQQPGAGINDPSVVPAPGSAALLMYYTRLGSGCAPFPNCIFTDNEVGMASSLDGGLTWLDHGILVSTLDGPGHCGAWAPSALVVGGEIWVYYHGGNPTFGPCEHPTGTVFRTRFDATGGQRLDTVVVPTPVPVVNVDVSVRPDGLFVMVGNSTDLGTIHRLTSPDGLDWTAGPPLLAGAVWAPTPHVTWVDDARFDLWFGWGEVPGNGFIHAVLRQRWRE